MNLRTSETVEHTHQAVETTADVPLVSNYPRSDSVGRQQVYERCVFRTALAVTGKHPLVFVALGFLSVLLVTLPTSIMSSMIREASEPATLQFRLLMTSFAITFAARFAQYLAASLATKYAGSEDKDSLFTTGSVLKSPQSWVATMILVLVTLVIGLLSSMAAGKLSATLDLEQFNLPSLTNLMTVPAVALVTFRFIFAPLIAATRKTGVIAAFRESAVMTQGIPLKALGWTLTLWLLSLLAFWLTQFDASILRYAGFLMPFFWYIVLGVWYARLVKTVSE
jgi:hypothetical protein